MLKGKERAERKTDMKNHKDRKAERSARKAFLREKKRNESKTEKALAASTDTSVIVMQVRDRTGGRARKVRRG
jgi:hypothetical protein